MVLVSPSLIDVHMKEPRLNEIFRLLEEDVEVQSYLKMANVMAVKRLMYNDHGPLHSRIASGAALEIFRILTTKIVPTTVKDGLCTLEDARLIVLCGAYLHDIGNAVHRVGHHVHGCQIANQVLDRLLSKVYPDQALRLKLKAEILHCVFAHDEKIRCLSVEAGSAKVADGTDMAEGRARIPYRSGKVDIHSLSALSIRSVEIVPGDQKPIRILVYMDNPAGVFQVEHVLERKIGTSGISDAVEAVVLERGKEIKRPVADQSLS